MIYDLKDFKQLTLSQHYSKNERSELTFDRLVFDELLPKPTIDYLLLYNQNIVPSDTFQVLYYEGLIDYMIMYDYIYSFNFDEIQVDRGDVKVVTYIKKDTAVELANIRTGFKSVYYNNSEIEPEFAFQQQLLHLGIDTVFKYIQ